MLRIVLVGIAALALVTGFGCYTMVRHPVTEMDVDLTSDKTCEDCHSQADQYHGSDPYDPFPYYNNYYSSLWQPYYATPWWRQDSWFGDHHSTPDGAPAETSGRPAWDRGPGAPAPVPGGSINGTYVPTPSAGSGSGSGTSASARDTTRTSKPEPAKPDTPRETKDQKKEREQNPRRPWSR